MEQASRAVRQLGSLMFEMEVLRSFLETAAELRYFDWRVNPAKLLAHSAVDNLKSLCPDQAAKLELTSTRCRVTKMDQTFRRYSETQLNVPEKQVNKTQKKKESVSLNDIAMKGISNNQEPTKQELLTKKKKELRFDEVVHDVQSDALRICNEKLKEKSNSDTWRMLEQEISDVKYLIESYHEKRTVTVKKTRSSNITTETYKQPPVSETRQYTTTTSRMYPMAGAVVGSCIGAPVGFLAGVKVGGLASLRKEFTKCQQACKAMYFYQTYFAPALKANFIKHTLLNFLKSPAFKVTL